LAQTGKAPNLPIVLFGKSYWQKVINFSALAETEMVDSEDCALFDFADSADEAWELMIRRGLTARS
jgi:predicted Rossmann-fold nucleotide-binding protein